jgi:hypothetical protein
VDVWAADWAEPACIANAVAAQTTTILPRSANFMTFFSLETSSTF